MESLSILDLSWNSLAGGLPAALGSPEDAGEGRPEPQRARREVPAEVGLLRELVFLDLSHNELAGPLPASNGRAWGSCSNLVLQENPHSGRPFPAAGGPGRSGGCRWWACPGSTGRSPASLAALPRLGRLNLSQNRLAGEIALPAEFVARLGRRLDVRGNDELCVGRGRYGGAQASYLGAPPCAAAGGGSGAAVGGTSSSPVESSAGAAATAGRGFRVYGIAGMFGGMRRFELAEIVQVVKLKGGNDKCG
ncbi:hypothetical protein OsJ_11883 [Oryza sativa Japonica Group]|uniref:Uncharacterized protein n=1 Tax=Oryza sativa subsp. japonica TaxID=39947 RepID=B9F9Y3_ORYSJ|nr:hypothetical protein OsJ_11883 [Oryza sativa Japonica Group]